MRRIVCALALAGFVIGGAAGQEADSQPTFTVQVDQQQALQASRAANGKYIAPELQLVKELDLSLLGMTKDGEAIYRAPAAAAAKIFQSDLVARVTKDTAEPATAQLMVGYKEADRKEVREKLEAAGMEVLEDNESATYFLVRPKQQELGIRAEAVRSLETSPATSLTPDYRVSIPPQPGLGARQQFDLPAATAVPNDYDPELLWGLERIGAPNAWNGITESAVVVAVIDTGVDYGHEDLQANMWKDSNGKHGHDYVNNDDNPMDDQGHGTHCAGTIAAVGNNDTGLVGVNWRAKIMALKFLDKNGSGSTSNAIKCIDYAVKNGAKVLNNSWGGGGFSPELKEAIDRAEAAGVLFIAAAGNSGTDNDKLPHYPSSYDNENIVAVMAINEDGERPTFSCFGAESVDVGAPGVGIASTIPNNRYTKFNGTSMATPHVSGACALVWSHTDHRKKNAKAIKELIQKNVSSGPALQGKCQWEGALHIGFLEGDVLPPKVFAFAKSENFSWKDEKTAEEATALLTVEISLPEPMEVQIHASSSVKSKDGKLRMTTGFSDKDTFDTYWDESLRFVDIPGGDTWINFHTSHAQQLPAGSHRIHWNVWPESPLAATFDSGTLVVQAFPLQTAANALQVANKGGINSRSKSSAGTQSGVKEAARERSGNKQSDDRGRERSAGERSAAEVRERLKESPSRMEDYPRVRALERDE